ncbi:GID complex subunit containing RING finger motif [Malassezia yamatoensis]|uniref:GID complex subunit containing RING finger motif n=1 Tax=Malassezia yamatoensis TaxID=253288 RepID=A0AAJ5YWR0_9BASI|nr:GID complex subunit containing RING finger motif [Malassezia yamatoensis]
MSKTEEMAIPSQVLTRKDLALTSQHISFAGFSSMEDMLIVEQPLLRVPLDEMRTQLKTQQRLWERDYLYCSNVLQGKLAKADQENAVDTLKESAQIMVARLQQLRQKLSELGSKADGLLKDTQLRYEYLHALQDMQVESQAFEDWCTIRLQRMVADYMLRRGAFSSAEKLAATQNITQLVDFPVFAQIRKVELSLVPDEHSTESPSCAIALAWCSENKITLRKSQSTLDFELRLQEFIELVRDRDPSVLKQAALYARKHLSPYLQETSDSEEQKNEASDQTHPRAAHTNTQETSRKAWRALGLLASGPGSWQYKDLYDAARWKSLRDAFRSIALQVYDLPASPLIHIALSAGLSSLKTHSCYSTKAKDFTPTVLNAISSQTSSMFLADSMEPDDPSRSDDRHPDCPICHTRGLGTLSREVPYSHQGNSRLICRITGKEMDDTNPPMCLPNGRVYSEEVRCYLLTSRPSIS